MKLSNSHQFSRQRICYKQVPRVNDITEDYYVRRHQQDDPRRTLGSCHIRPRSLWAHLEQLCALRMPRLTVAMATIAYSGIIFVCGLMSKDKNDDKEPSRSALANPCAEARQHRSGALNFGNSRDTELPMSELAQNETRSSLDRGDCTHVPLRTGGRGLNPLQEPTITSAIVASCFQPWISSEGEPVDLCSEPKVAVREVHCLFPYSGTGCTVEDLDALRYTTSNAQVEISAPDTKCLQKETVSGWAFSEKLDLTTTALPVSSKEDDGWVRNQETHPSPPSCVNLLSTTSAVHTFLSEGGEDTTYGDNRFPAGQCPKSFPTSFIHNLYSLFGYVLEVSRMPTYRNTVDTPPNSVHQNISTPLEVDPANSSAEKIPSAHSLASHMMNRLITSKNVVFDDSSFTRKQVSTVQLLSLMISPESCL